MNRKALRRQADAVVSPMLTRGELFRRAGPVWAVEQRGRAPLFLRARDLHVLVLTDQRLILFGRPRRRRPLGVNDLVIAKRYSTFTPVRARRFRPMLQLRLRTSADRVLVLEFRPRDRGLAHELVRELGPPQPDADRDQPGLGKPSGPTDEQDLADLLRE
ncbi:MAG: hypothetical protein ACRDY6_02005 [Acidimicrobiia bacterium]